MTTALNFLETRHHAFRGEIIASPGRYENERVWAPYFDAIASLGERLTRSLGCREDVWLVQISDVDRIRWPSLPRWAVHVLVMQADGHCCCTCLGATAADAIRQYYSTEEN